MAALLELYDIADKNGVGVYAFELTGRPALSLENSGGECYIAIDPYQLENSAEETVCLAHDLGHCMTGSFYTEASPLTVRRKMENTADRWAIYTTIPRSEFEAALIDGCDTLYELADRFNVTEAFAAKAAGLYLNGNLAGV